MSPVSLRSLGARGSFLIILALGVAWVAPPRASAPIPQKGGNKTVFAAAMDADNKPVTDLTKEEWGVREDGADRVLVDLKRATEPLDVVLMVDTTKSIGSSVNELRSALKSFAHAIVAGSPGATIALMDVAAAAVIVGDNRKGPEDFDKLLSKTFADQGSESAVFLEGMVDAAKKLAKSPSPRRAIVIVNLDGIPESSTLQPQQVIQQVLLSGASMWAVSYSNQTSRLLIINQGSGAGAATGGKGGGIGSSNTGQNRDVLLANIPPGTGGVRVTIDVASALEQKLNELAAVMVGQYEVTYTRPDGPMPKQVQMGQVRPGVKLTYPSTPAK